MDWPRNAGARYSFHTTQSPSRMPVCTTPTMLPFEGLLGSKSIMASNSPNCPEKRVPCCTALNLTALESFTTFHSAAKALPTFPAKLGAPYWALRDQHETNPWISAEVLNEALRVVSGAQGGRMFLHEWSLNAGDGVLPAELDSAEWDELTALYDGDYCRLAGGATMLGQFIGTMLDPIVGLADTTAASGVFASVAPPVAQEAIQPKRVYTLKQLDEITGWPESTLRNAIA